MTLRILVADDEEDSWTLMHELVRDLGLADRVANGHEAVAANSLAIIDQEPYDLIFLDIMMPGIDGYETVQRIRMAEADRGIFRENRCVIIMTSALFSREHQAKAMAMGATDYLVKPIRKQALMEKVRRHIALDSTQEATPEEEKRKFDRPLFHSRAELVLESGRKLPGRTRDVSFNGVLLQVEGEFRPQPGDKGLIRIALSDAGEIESSFVAFPCEVVRDTPQGIALKMSLAAAKAFANEPVSPAAVAVSHSGGIVDQGWEILGFNERIPEDVMAELKRRIDRMRKDGPVVVCCKRGEKPDENLFKVVNIPHLKEIQKLTRNIPNA